jgi:regulator of RNase E activity RraB
MAEDLDQQLSLTADLVAQRISMGDNADVPRQVDHLAFFKKAKADAAVHDLETAGFTITDVQRKLLKVGIEFHRTDACDQETAAGFTREVIAIVNRHDGSYDGWASFLAD